MKTSEDSQKTIERAIADRIAAIVYATPGVAGLSAGSRETERLASADKQRHKEIRVGFKDLAVQINIHLNVIFGKPIPEIVRLIQRKAKAMFDREFPEYDLTAVNVRVDGVRFDQHAMRYREQAVLSLGEKTNSEEGALDQP